MSQVLTFADISDARGATLAGNMINFGSFNIVPNETVTKTFQVKIKSLADKNCQKFVITNTFGNTVVINIDAPCVVAVENPALRLSKSAYNDTQKADATAVNAHRGDYITYSLMVSNPGSVAVTNFTVTDDLSGVLPFADIVDPRGGTVTGTTINFPGLTIPAGQTVTKTFQVRVKGGLVATQSFMLVNTYGNTINILVPVTPGKPVPVAPKTGADPLDCWHCFLFYCNCGCRRLEESCQI